MEVTLYTREGCHLCETARAQLEAHGLSPHEVDIDQDAELRNQFGNCVPVVAFDGKVRFKGRVSELLLRRLLSQHVGQEV